MFRLSKLRTVFRWRADAAPIQSLRKVEYPGDGHRRRPQTP